MGTRVHTGDWGPDRAPLVQRGAVLVACHVPRYS